MMGLGWVGLGSLCMDGRLEKVVTTRNTPPPRSPNARFLSDRSVKKERKNVQKKDATPPPPERDCQVEVAR